MIYLEVLGVLEVQELLSVLVDLVVLAAPEALLVSVALVFREVLSQDVRNIVHCFLRLYIQVKSEMKPHWVKLLAQNDTTYTHTLGKKLCIFETFSCNSHEHYSDVNGIWEQSQIYSGF